MSMWINKQFGSPKKARNSVIMIGLSLAVVGFIMVLAGLYLR